MAKAKAEKTDTQAIPIHEWTNGGDEVLVLRFSDKNGQSYGGFQHPLEIGKGDGSDGKLKADTWYELSPGGKFMEKKL